MTAGPRHRSSRRTADATGDDPPLLVIITEDAQIRDDVALIAAVAGLAVEASSRWEEVPAGSRSHTVWACGPDSLPPVGRAVPSGYAVGDALLVIGQDAHQVWQASTERDGALPVPLPEAEQWLSAYLSEAMHSQRRGAVVVTSSTAGGVGATTMAYLGAAECAVRGDRPLIIDATAAAHNRFTELLEHRQSAAGEQALTWDTLSSTEGEISPAHLASSVPHCDGIGILTGHAESTTITRRLLVTVQAARRAFDLVVVDVGSRWDCAAALAAVADQHCIVSRACPRGARTAVELADRTGLPAHVVLNRKPLPGWGPAQMNEATGLPLAAELAEQRWLSRTDQLDDTYEVLRSPRGAALAGDLLSWWEAADG